MPGRGGVCLSGALQTLPERLVLVRRHRAARPATAQASSAAEQPLPPTASCPPGRAGPGDAGASRGSGASSTSAGAPEPLGRRAPADSRPPLHSVGSGGVPGGGPGGSGPGGGAGGGHPRSPFVAGVVVAGMGDADDVSTGTPGTPSSSPSLNAEQARCGPRCFAPASALGLGLSLRVGLRQYAADLARPRVPPQPLHFYSLLLAAASGAWTCAVLVAGARTPAIALCGPGSTGSLPLPALTPARATAQAASWAAHRDQRVHIMNLRGTPSLECTGSERYDLYIDRASAYAKAHERALAASLRESAEGALAAIATSKVPPAPIVP
jgi:hypothetical protein